MSNVEFVDNSKEVLSVTMAAVERALEKCGLVAESNAKKLCPVDTGNLRNSITHTVHNNEAYVGTNVEYGIYQEFGTGKYYPGGRNTPWIYTDIKGETHWTMGNKAQPFIRPAISRYRETYKEIIEKELEGQAVKGFAKKK